ncbi:MAG: hypothetical protein COB49_08055 [Alphaproteobacteria bacterium]|nr:MAG: hypothetical protein COB49_08055 [Alphaproteobacteria bacterium]
MAAFTFRIFLMALVVIFAPSAVSGHAMASEEEKTDDEATKESYIKLSPFVVTMYHRGRPKGNMLITVLVKLVDSEKRETARKYLPRLNNAYVMEASRLSHGYFDVTRPVNVAMLGDAFQLATNKILGHRQARVLISEVIVNQK